MGPVGGRVRPWQRGGTFDVVAFAASVVTAFSMRARARKGRRGMEMVTADDNRIAGSVDGITFTEGVIV